MSKFMMMLAVVGVLAGCASDPFKIPQVPAGKDCTPVKESTGSAAGMLILGCIPAGRNGMVERAYNEAVPQHGDYVLLNPVYEDSWAWTPVGNLFFTSVKGTLAKCNK